MFTKKVKGKDLRKHTKFEVWVHDDIMQCDTMSLEGLDQFNANHNKVMVFREKIKDEYRYRNQYTLVVACEAFGELGGQYELPHNPRRTAKSLKDECFQILETCFANNNFTIDL